MYDNKSCINYLGCDMVYYDDKEMTIKSSKNLRHSSRTLRKEAQKVKAVLAL